jgi:hypothetical protein
VILSQGGLLESWLSYSEASDVYPTVWYYSFSIVSAYPRGEIEIRRVVGVKQMFFCNDHPAREETPTGWIGETICVLTTIPL